MTYAIVKPDHLGDLVLSSAAIRAIGAAHPDSVLFVASKNRGLARYLFPDIEIAAMDLAHLSKDGGTNRVPDLTGFETVAFLRSDAVLTENWAALRTGAFLLPRDTHGLHQSVIDYSVASLLAGPYDIDARFYGDRADRVLAKAITPPRRIGLSIGSGFHANTWPIARWVDAMRMLLNRANAVTILCGPAEQDKAHHILAQAGRPGAVDIVVGGQDVGAFVDAVDGLDLVVASDGGTAHLCSLVTPVISIFGPSPFRRYAPYGRLNRLMTRELSCSPCCQYATDLVNGCLTIECMTHISVRHLERALALPLALDTAARGLPATQGNVHFYIGVSHLARNRRLAHFNHQARLLARDHDLPAWRGVAARDLLADVQDARLALVDALDRLKRARPGRYAVCARRVAYRFAQLRDANLDARAFLDGDGGEAA